MTDRVHSLTVILDKSTRTDDVEPLMQAIAQMRGVSKVIVKPEDIDEPVFHSAREQALQELRQRMADVLWPKGGR